MSLTTYVATAILAWTAIKGTPTPDAEVERLHTIADDIATVIEDTTEPPLFPADTMKAETAIQVASVGFFESRFWTFVDNGDCNRIAWKLEHKHPKELCDGGDAWSFWQIHPRYTKGNGIVLDGLGWRHDPDGYKGPDLIYDRKLAVRISLHMIRSSLQRSGTLCGYTGETEKGCPKARIRRDHAHAYVTAHPFAE